MAATIGDSQKGDFICAPLFIEASALLRTGNPATVALARCRPEALRPTLSRGLREMQFLEVYRPGECKTCSQLGT
jgi:hypothetical protein